MLLYTSPLPIEFINQFDVIETFTCSQWRHKTKTKCQWKLPLLAEIASSRKDINITRMNHIENIKRHKPDFSLVLFCYFCLFASFQFLKKHRNVLPCPSGNVINWINFNFIIYTKNKTLKKKFLRVDGVLSHSLVRNLTPNVNL